MEPKQQQSKYRLEKTDTHTLKAADGYYYDPNDVEGYLVKKKIKLSRLLEYYTESALEMLTAIGKLSK